MYIIVTSCRYLNFSETYLYAVQERCSVKTVIHIITKKSSFTELVFWLCEYCNA